ncbi:MAG: TIM barrel protein, partial [Verrucomicrobiota bacterium]
MKRINLLAISIILITTAGNSAPKIAIMETALGNRAKVESLAQAKEAGYAGVQLHTGELDEAGVLTMAEPALIAALVEAREKTGIEIVSLCAGSMNKFSSWDPETRGVSLSIGKQSIDACVALDTPMLLIPFFGKGWFGNDTRDEKFMAAVGLVKELSLYAEQKGVTLGI